MIHYSGRVKIASDCLRFVESLQYLLDDKLTFVYNYLALDRITLAGKESLPKGKAILVVDFASDGKPGEFGKGGMLSTNGHPVAEGRLDKTIPIAALDHPPNGKKIDTENPRCLAPCSLSRSWVWRP